MVVRYAVDTGAVTGGGRRYGGTVVSSPSVEVKERNGLGRRQNFLHVRLGLGGLWAYTLCGPYFLFFQNFFSHTLHFLMHPASFIHLEKPILVKFAS
jgi:hypothetical protein